MDKSDGASSFLHHSGWKEKNRELFASTMIFIRSFRFVPLYYTLTRYSVYFRFRFTHILSFRLLLTSFNVIGLTTFQHINILFNVQFPRNCAVSYQLIEHRKKSHNWWFSTKKKEKKRKESRCQWISDRAVQFSISTCLNGVYFVSHFNRFPPCPLLSAFFLSSLALESTILMRCVK